MLTLRASPPSQKPEAVAIVIGRNSCAGGRNLRLQVEWIASLAVPRRPPGSWRDSKPPNRADIFFDF